MTVTEASKHSVPDFKWGALDPQTFRKGIMENGAVMLRGAGDPVLLARVRQSLVELFTKYSTTPQSEIERGLKSSDPLERDYWEQIKLSHIFDRTFKRLAGYSYYEIVRQSGLWKFLARAFPEAELTESPSCNCRRVSVGERREFWDSPVEFHVDAQVFYDHKLSINFWTPLNECGATAPGLEVVLLGVQDTKAYLEHNPAGYEPRPGDFGHMKNFRCAKMQLPVLQEHGLGSKRWAPEFDVGDILAFTNFTMHATHSTASMTEPRMSVEIRVDLE
jgi:hypothetical protein